MRFVWLLSGLSLVSFGLGLIEPFAADVFSGRKIHYSSPLGHFGVGAIALLVVGIAIVLATRRQLETPQDPASPAD